jgi:hypothetical protein
MREEKKKLQSMVRDLETELEATSTNNAQNLNVLQVAFEEL